MRRLKVALLTIMLRSVHERILPAGGSGSACECVLERIREKEILSNPFSTAFTRERRH